MNGTLDSLFAWLDAEVGVAEVSHQNVVILRDGSNLWKDYFGYQPPPDQAAWCALFQSVADWKNGTPIPPIQFSKGFVGVDVGREWFRQQGLLVPTPQPGYLAFYHEHVGRVRRITGPRTFDAIEGNEGDAVRIVHRTADDIVGGFGVRTYTASEEDDMPWSPEDSQNLSTLANSARNQENRGTITHEEGIRLTQVLQSIDSKLDRVIANTSH